MNQVPVQWTAESFLKEQRTTLHRIPVVPLSALRMWLKEEFRCDCGRGLFGEPHLVWCKHRIYERLLASLGEK